MANERPEVRLNYWPDTLERLEEIARGRARHIAELIVQEIENSPLTPVRKTDLNRQPPPGNLKHSFFVVEDPAGDILVLSDARYWMFVEYGSRGKEGVHFLRHAIDVVEKAFE